MSKESDKLRQEIEALQRENKHLRQVDAERQAAIVALQEQLAVCAGQIAGSTHTPRIAVRADSGNFKRRTNGDDNDAALSSPDRGYPHDRVQRTLTIVLC